ncbi:hypothetical protein HNR06_001879 [Nocardiopsis arvandica]|uniref:Uncharacterized protein n=1 Tax=Nocardiopsis sinuspersici TaxID=501010 RepID=A0A7Z0BJP2_9ACTN|nr:hypothetical protein [Nocardiopsis sinuspersici]
MPSSRSGGAPRSEAGRTYVGWRHAVLLPPPGPAPRRPTPADTEAVSEEWIAAQRDNEARTNRPLYFALAGLALFSLLFPLLWTLRILPGSFALGGVFACAAIAAPISVALAQSRRVVAERLERARERLAAERDERDRALHERQREHARRYTEWQAAARAYEAQPLWYGVTADVGTVVVVGGDEAGWSALLATLGVSRLREGGDLTVVDLTGRSVVRELVRLARRCAVAPRRWVLPADLPRMTLGTNLDAGQRARILSAVAAASGDAGGGTDGADADETLLLRLLEVLGPRAGIAELIGGLRALLTPEDDAAADDPALALLTPEQRVRVRERCADGPDLRRRAWELERRLSPFEAVGTRADGSEYAQVKIISTDRASGRAAARVYGTYAVSALSELLEVPEQPRTVDGRRSRARPERTRTVVVCGAETLPPGEVDQVLTAAADSGVEVVLMFRTAAPTALARFSDPGCLPVVMRQGGGSAADAARAVAAAPGVAGHDPGGLRLHRLTEVIGEAVGDSVTGAGEDPDAEVEADDRFFPSPHTESGAVIRNAAAALTPLDLVRHVRSATAWGRATAQAAEADAPATAGDGGAQPVRTCGLDAESLRGLPSTAALVLTADGPVLADTNPGILTLSTATLATVDDSRNTAARPGVGDGGTAAESRAGRGRRTVDGRPRIAAPGPATPDTPDGAAPGSGSPTPVGADGQVPPNLGPPPERLDWRG